ncbi:hypothetical protein PG999_013142 [Apiospora kogelbergensis]|uniref:Rhodopsin domain-containing protein n=1 Tax=Apiospora kogelbergensis TaxID=1337665 RepID=A0AAW0Q8Z6_9PEZI
MSGQPLTGSLPPPPPLPFRTDVDFNENRQVEIHLVAWICTTIAILVVALKLFARARIVKMIGWDDFFIFLSMALSIIASAFVSYSVTLGFGRHTIAVAIESDGPERLVNTAMWQQLGYREFPFNIGAFSFPNISIAILVVKLLDPWPARTRALYAMVIVQVVLAMISIIIVFRQCQPTAKVWNKQLPGTCWNPDVLNNYSYFLSAYTTLTDIVLAVVPISAFWKLQMPTNTRVGLCIMMGLTLLSAIVTIVKATYLMFDVVPLVIWGLIEQNVVIVAACIPTLRPFFHKAFKGERSSGKRSEGSGGSSGTLGSKLGSSTFFSHPRSRQNHRRLDDSVLDYDPREDEPHGQSHNHDPHDAIVLEPVAQDTSPEARAGLDEDCAESNSSQKGIWRTLQVNMEWDAEAQQKHTTRFPFVPDAMAEPACISLSEMEGKKKKHVSTGGRLTRH